VGALDVSYEWQVRNWPATAMTLDMTVTQMMMMMTMMKLWTQLVLTRRLLGIVVLTWRSSGVRSWQQVTRRLLVTSRWRQPSGPVVTGHSPEVDNDDGDGSANGRQWRRRAASLQRTSKWDHSLAGQNGHTANLALGSPRTCQEGIPTNATLQ